MASPSDEPRLRLNAPRSGPLVVAGPECMGMHCLCALRRLGVDQMLPPVCDSRGHSLGAKRRSALVQAMALAERHMADAQPGA
jgi:hypothetical protein